MGSEDETRHVVTMPTFIQAIIKWQLLILILELATLVCMQKLGGSGSMLPQENIFEFDAVRWLLRLFLGPKTSPLILALVLAW